ncbi:hypothetical protein QTG54_007702 [Skeletonema marinoi]|uniref:Chlorophyllase n=1 Tax=Skeletonema marinoi TaxID=267567 RepID=A0AAD8YAP2_9STRA|nr:hypothetical protein QTG54_007702 [Skeletonema marinoi]
MMIDLIYYLLVLLFIPQKYTINALLCGQQEPRRLHIMSSSKNDDYYSVKQAGDLDKPVVDRRQIIIQSSTAVAAIFQQFTSPVISYADEESTQISRGTIFEIQDPNSYSAVVYIPKATDGKEQAKQTSLPLLVVLHGAGVNEHSALYEFTNPGGDHTNLPPYLLSTQQAPPSLSENFVVVAPYVGQGKRSLYDEPRSKMLSFIKWFNTYMSLRHSMMERTSQSTDRKCLYLLF